MACSLPAGDTEVSHDHSGAPFWVASVATLRLRPCHDAGHCGGRTDQQPGESPYGADQFPGPDQLDLPAWRRCGHLRRHHPFFHEVLDEQGIASISLGDGRCRGSHGDVLERTTALRPGHRSGTETASMAPSRKAKEHAMVHGLMFVTGGYGLKGGVTDAGI